MIKSLYKSIFPERIRNNFRKFIFQSGAIFYYGNNYTCNCCNRSFRKFKPYGNIKRENVLCPYCHSLERTRLLLFYLERETSVFKGGLKILHFAPEPIIESKLKKSRNDYYSADINPALADHTIDITNITFPDHYFDLVICSHVLGHVPNEEKAIDEIYRVLKTGGRALILTVIDPHSELTIERPDITTEDERLFHYGEKDLQRKHGKDFELRIQRKGVKVEKVLYFQNFKNEERIRYSLGNGDRETIFNCLKL